MNFNSEEHSMHVQEKKMIVDTFNESRFITCWNSGCDITPLVATISVIFITVVYYVFAYLANLFIDGIMALAILMFAIFYTLGAIISVRELIRDNRRRNENQRNGEELLIQIC